MKVKVGFEAEAHKTPQSWLEVEIPNYTNGEPSGRTVLLPASVCTPVLPDFSDGDIVQHEPSGSVGKVEVFWASQTVVSDNGFLSIRVPDYGEGSDEISTFIYWPAVECTIVKKAGD